MLPPGLEISIGKDPAGSLDPRQHSERKRVGHEHPIRQPIELRNTLEVPSREGRNDRVIRRVEDRRYKLKVLTLFERSEEFRNREGLSSNDPVLITPGDPNLPEVLLREGRTQPFASFVLLVRPEPVSRDKTRSRRVSASHSVRPPGCRIVPPLIPHQVADLPQHDPRPTWPEVYAQIQAPAPILSAEPWFGRAVRRPVAASRRRRLFRFKPDWLEQTRRHSRRLSPSSARGSSEAPSARGPLRRSVEPERACQRRESHSRAVGPGQSAKQSGQPEEIANVRAGSMARLVSDANRCNR